MPAWRGLRVRFHYVATALLVVLVIALMSVFLLSVLHRFEEMAREHARAVFAQVADRNALKLQETLARAGRVVGAHAAFEAPAYRAALSRLDADAPLAGLFAELRVNPQVYGFYVGFDDGAFLQLVGVRGNAGVIAALSAPASTWFALRSITADGARRVETWRFYDEAAHELGRRSADAVYLPQSRPWYSAAMQRAGLQATDPYVFQSSGELGVTLSQALAGGQGVFGADLALGELAAFVGASLGEWPGGVAVLDGAQRLLLYHASGGLGASRPPTLQPLTSADDPFLGTLRADGLPPASGSVTAVLGRDFVFAGQEVTVAADTTFQVVAFAPVDAFAGAIERARDDLVRVSALVLCISLPIAFFAARHASRTLGLLARDSERVMQMDFSGAVEVRSMFYEIDTLSEAHRTMKASIQARTRALNEALDKLESLVDNGLRLSAERDHERLLAHILGVGKRLCNADAASLLMVTPEGSLRFALRSRNDPLPQMEIPLHDPHTGAPNEHFVAVWVALHRQTVRIDDTATETRFDVSGARGMDSATGYRTVSMLTVPMTSSGGEVIGVLQFLNATDPETGAPVAFPAQLVPYVEALASQSAVALDNHNLLDSQQKLMDALVRLVAGAIDAKSPYTGGHCERVPELAVMLAEAACEADSGPLAAFRFDSEEEWREFRIGAWLHDCGKVTTPEYVVDKATKLETIYNRIHEVRTRFEVLLRDAEIERLQRLLQGEDAEAANTAFAARKARLQDEFRFVAECNIGGEAMEQGHQARLRDIGGQTWLRHFDDRLGLSQDELRRRADLPAAGLPAVETLLADHPWQVVPRPAAQRFDPRYGFRVRVPENLYNFGELYNLSVTRGTLTEEERFKINEHIMQTIIMLDALPLPRQLARVPEYAGTHHETLTGSGYPKGLAQEELSIPARIMAVADIFEALTAADRPYKKAKPLSEAIAILARLARQRHVDPDVFALFLRSGVYLRYAQRFLDPAQIDDVDIDHYLAEVCTA
ncbi:HD domain-containing phosphohydrolase [Azoarcus olearius]|uniref:HD-domain containing protein n=1 Tax=Azoarcus sp. (strain BH72) TaxID=418699 RepID=A1K343_AZOSB|nr:HD domain-containing phosphohydrolase [Azoarcus olearius]CAL93248.1 HD-domain containing protein [Azoarcus olearius]